jgi:hypothetical protein
MTTEEKSTWTDEQLVENTRKWAIELSTCRLNMVKHNRIMDRELSPIQTILTARGANALQKLLPLMQDRNPTVRWVAASFAYDVAPDMCRRVLEEVMSDSGMVGILAWAFLAYKNLDAPPDPGLIGGMGASDSGDDTSQL